LAVGLVVALVVSLLSTVSLLNPPRAFAALGEVPLITYNMQGQSTGIDSKWATTIATYANQAEIVMLQEAGANPPTDAPGSQRETLSGNQLANGGAGLPPGRGSQVIHSQWRNGYATQDVYFLQTDRAGGLWNGGRVNLAIVTQRAAEAVVALPNPLWTAGTAGGERPRATLGVLFDGVWYFNLHALSGGGGDAPGLLTSISNFVTGRGQNELDRRGVQRRLRAVPGHRQRPLHRHHPQQSKPWLWNAPVPLRLRQSVQPTLADGIPR
jgi:hypothetical protein